MIPFFIYLLKNPYLDYSWLESTSQETAEKTTKKGIYTSKPVIIKHASGHRIFINTFGMSLFFKEDKVICAMNRKFFKKLNEPSLTEFFTALISKIDEYLEKKKLQKK